MPAPISSPGRALAEAISAIHGTKPVTITVKMIGGPEVSALLKKLRQARSVTPSRTFRVKAQSHQIAITV